MWLGGWLAQFASRALRTRRRKSSICGRRAAAWTSIAAQVDWLEQRTLLSTFVVTTNADSGGGSLRQAIVDANNHIGADTINFNIPGAGSHTITPLTSLPDLIDAQTKIDATTQPGFFDVQINPSPELDLKPLIELNFSRLPVGTAGLYLSGNSCEVWGLAINRANGVGLWLAGSNSLISSNFIGTDVTGTLDYGNLYQGIYVQSSGNTIVWNLISGNDANGVWLNGPSASGNFLRNNLIGTNSLATAPLGNGINGIVAVGGINNVIDNNVVAANGNTGVWIIGGQTNFVRGNSIGTNTNGATTLGNHADGLRITDGASSNVLSTNVISKNWAYGLSVYTDSTTRNYITGNTIGLATDGTTPLGNTYGGVFFGGTGNFLGGGSVADRNVISGNGTVGVWVAGTVQSISGNYIGTDRTGALDRGNGTEGVYVTNSSNSIFANLISGNDGTGVFVLGTSANRNVIYDNKIGTDVSGSTVLGNGTWGVIVGAGSDNLVGTVNSGGTTSNLISGNNQGGVAIIGATAARNVVSGNKIGTDVTGLIDRGNAYSGVYTGQGSGFGVTGIASGTRITNNLISGNNNYGIWIAQEAGTIVQGNSIGIGSDGQTPVGNSLDGVYVNGTQATIGGTDPGQRNIISANGRTGIWLVGGSNHVLGNYIGIDATGNLDRGNATDGVAVASASNDIGGNVISGNDVRGVIFYLDQSDSNQLYGNLIGTNAAGTGPIGNSDWGVLVTQGDNNFIGIASSFANPNVISGNRRGGIAIVGANTSGNRVQHNLVGTDVTGLVGLANTEEGVFIGNGSSISSAFAGVASSTQVGGSTSESRNVITSSVSRSGVRVEGNASATIQGNYLGIGADGLTVLGNRDYGVLLAGNGNTVGGNGDGQYEAEEGNLISGNRVYGVMITGDSNRVANNLIGTDLTGNLLRVNRYEGIEIRGASNSIAYNVIVQTGDTGIVNLVGDASDNNRLWGNKIGTNASGTQQLGGATVGIAIVGGDNNEIGTPSDQTEDRNVIVGNSFAGIAIGGTGTTGNSIRNNAIGTDASGVLRLRNQSGIYVGDTTQFGFPGSPTDTFIGGTSGLDENLVAFNSSSGIQITGVGAERNSILRNQIYANGGLGIDLGGDGVTSNDTGDADTGPNDFQNFPVLNAVIPGATSWVQGHMSGKANSSFTLQFYRNELHSSWEQGQIWIGSWIVTTDATGEADFDLEFNVTIAAGDTVTATAMDSVGNTSEFSQSILAVVPDPLAVSIVTPSPAARNTVVASLEFSFSEPLNPATLTIDDLKLTRDGGPNLLTGSEFLLRVSDTHYQLAGLDALTSNDGQYRFSINIAEVQGRLHNSGVGSVATEWVMDATSPTVRFSGEVVPAFRNTALDSVELTFSEAINATTLTTSDLTLNRGSTSLVLGNEVTINYVTGSTYRISGLASLTRVNGGYSLTINAAGVTDLVGNLGTGLAFVSWTMDTVVPVLLSIGAVSPVPRTTPVTSLAITFSESISPATLTVGNFSLTRDGGTNLLTGNEPITGSGKIWTLGGLTGMTASDGNYVLTVNGVGVADLAGNPVTGQLSRSWLMSVPPQVVSISSIGPTLRNSPVESIDVIFSKPIDPQTVSAADFVLLRSNVNVLTGSESVIQVSPNRFRLSGIADRTGAAGSYRLTVSAIGVRDLNGVPGKGTVSQGWTVDLVAPKASSIAKIVPNPRSTSVNTMSVTLSEIVDLGSFTASDFLLTRDGGPNLLMGSENVSLVSGKTYQISGLEALTSADGTYVLSLDATGFNDPAGNAGIGNISTSWTTDTVAPISAVLPFPSATATSLSVILSIQGSDPVPSNGAIPTGIKNYDIYVSTDDGPLSLWKTVNASTTSSITKATFLAQSDHSYKFLSVARDRAGNVESKDLSVAEARVVVPDLSPPQTQVTRVDTSSSTFTISMQGADVGSNGIVAYFDLYVSVDGAASRKIATIPTTSQDADGVYRVEANYRAISDGSEHTYRFFSIGKDGGNKIETAPVAPADVFVTATFPPISASLDIQRSETQRSLVRYVELEFNRADDLAGIVASINDGIAGNEGLTLKRFTLSGTTPVKIPLSGKAFAEGTKVILDFGPLGLTDGYYELGLDLDGNGSIETLLHFDRLQGDLNGDRIVDNNDVSLLATALNTNDSSRFYDLNSDGVLDAKDQTKLNTLLTHRLNSDLPLDD